MGVSQLQNLFWFCSTMPVECTNSNLKSAQMAQLRQPAKNWNWICTFHRHIRAKSKTVLLLGDASMMRAERY